MNIILNLNHHCIATEVKKLYNKAVSQYFKPDADIEKLEKRIEIFKYLLEKSDFAYLRNTYPELRGHCASNVQITTEHNGQIFIILNHNKIEIPFIKN